MNPLHAYQRQRSPGQPRIDTILLLYETLILRLQEALASWRANDQAAAKKRLAACQVAVTSLASGFANGKDELSVNLLRLYEFVGHCLTSPSEASISSALQVLQTLQEGFQQIRPEAIQLERSGAIPPLDRVRTFQIRA